MVEATSQASPGNNTGRLIYADPRSLPSFPSSGLPENGAAAGAAATLGWHNQKPVELWTRPQKMSSASAAAVLAKDYKMAPMWEPTPDSSGHKAALLAVGSASTALKHHQSDSIPNPHQGWGNSAATQAFLANRLASDRKTSTRDLSHGNTAATQAFNTNRDDFLRNDNVANPQPYVDRSLLAAQGAMSSSRPRASSTPSSQEFRLQSSNTANAMSGATSAHRASMQAKPPMPTSGAIPITTMTRNMFTAHPMMKSSVDEQADSERLHQSAVEMARKMYIRQQKMMDQAQDVHGAGPDRMRGSHPLNLQDAAYRQAQERLAKLQNEHQKNCELQEYYGNTQTPRRRFTVTGKLSGKLRRKQSDGEFEDHQQSQKIRQEMSIFSHKLSEVDQTKRQHDRDILLAAAQRNVKARLHGMDEKVYQDTGKVPPALLSEWEVKAQQAAQSRSENRNENRGKVDLGGGLFMGQDEVDAIASRRMQPIMNDIDEKAGAERARQANIKLEEEAKKDANEKQKARDRESKALTKQIKSEEKQEQKARKQQDKFDKVEQKRLAKEGKGRSKHDSVVGGIVSEDTVDERATTSDRDDIGLYVAVTSTGALRDGENHQPPVLILSPEALEHPEYSFTGPVDTPPIETTIAGGANVDPPMTPEAEPERSHFDDDERSTSPRHKVRDWIRNRLHRGKSVSQHDDVGEGKKNRRSFFRITTALQKNHPNGSTPSLNYRESSMRDIAMAGKPVETGKTSVNGAQEAESETGTAEAAGVEDRESRGVSPVSSMDNMRSPVEDSRPPIDDSGSSIVENMRSSDGFGKSPDADMTSPSFGTGYGDHGEELPITPPKFIEDPAPRSSVSPTRDSRFREVMDI